VGAGSWLQEAGLQTGDVITDVEKHGGANTPHLFEQQLQLHLTQGRPIIRLGVWRLRERLTLFVKPSYPLKDLNLLVVLPPQATNHPQLSLITDRLTRRGARVTTVNGAALDPLDVKKFSGAILLDGEGADGYERHEGVKTLIAAMQTPQKVLAGTGQVPALLLKMDPTLASKRLTFKLEALESVKHLKPNYTNAEIEEDDGVVTAKSESDKTLKAFVERVAAALVQRKPS